MNTLLHPSHLRAFYLIFWIALYGGIELDCLDCWNHFKPLGEFEFLFGWVVSSLLSCLIIWRTFKKKSYVNLLWLALPVGIFWGVDFFLCEPLSRPFLIAVVLMAVISSLWSLLNQHLSFRVFS